MILARAHTIGTLLILAAFAAVVVYDVRFLRIPNQLGLAIAAIGMFHASSAGGIRGIFASLLGAVTGIALAAWPFWRGYLGAGDVKLLGAIGCWVGMMGVVRVVLFGAIGGGLLSVLYLLRLSQVERADVTRKL